MSIDQKQQIANALTWVLRILTAVGAFFLTQTYGLMKDTNQLLQQHLIDQGKHNSAMETTVDQHEREINKHDYRILRLEGITIENKLRDQRDQHDKP